MPPSPKLQALRARLSRVMFIITLGFAIVAVSGLLTAPLLERLRERLGDGSSVGMGGVLAELAIARLGIYVVMPAVAYAAARLVDLKPWPSALGLAVMGEGVNLALEGLTTGFEGFFSFPLGVAFRALTLIGGTWLTAVAIRAARRGAERAEAPKVAEKAARDAEYAHFLEEAKRVADLPRSPSSEAPRGDAGPQNPGTGRSDS